MLELHKKLTSSKIFKDWKSENKESFLCNFIIIENKPQFDFYNKDNTITSFRINNKIEIDKNQKVLKKNRINPLKLEKIKLSKEKVMEIIKERYPKEIFNKKIIILQNPKQPIWNITLITSSLKLLNIKIDMNEKIVSETFEPLTKIIKRVK